MPRPSEEPDWTSREELTRLFEEERMSQEELADYYGVGQTTVRKYLNRWNIGKEEQSDAAKALDPTLGDGADDGGEQGHQALNAHYS